MPSLQTSVVGFILMALVILQICTASPLPMPEPAVLAADCGPGFPSKPITPAPTLPASALPTTNLTFQYAAIGRGIQNYTCTAVGATPVALGAIATLYDATAIALASVSILNTIPGLAVNTPPTAAGYVLPAPYNRLSKLGNHYFLADGTPTFDLTSVKKILFAKKNAFVDAPANAPKGPAGTGAVQWLDLVAKPGYASVQLGEVYRVETAGGNAPTTCASVGVTTVQYAAEYWFYV